MGWRDISKINESHRRWGQTSHESSVPSPIKMGGPQGNYTATAGLRQPQTQTTCHFILWNRYYIFLHRSMNATRTSQISYAARALCRNLDMGCQVVEVLPDRHPNGLQVGFGEAWRHTRCQKLQVAPCFLRAGRSLYSGLSAEDISTTIWVLQGTMPTNEFWILACTIGSWSVGLWWGMT